MPEKLDLSWSYRARAVLHAFKRRFSHADEFDWRAYPSRYQAELAYNRQTYTEDLGSTEWTVAGNRLFLRGDAKPLHPGYLAIFEAFLHLRPSSVSEIGMGGGRYLAGLRHLLGPSCVLRGYDLSAEQMALFGRLYPAEAAGISTAQLDITQASVPRENLPDAVLASTVLMHIQRPEAYQRALDNLIASAMRYVIVLDNYQHHDYLADLGRVPHLCPYVYATGRATVLVATVDGSRLAAPFEALHNAEQLA